MAYEIIGNVFQIGTTENIPTKSGNPFRRRSLILVQRRFDQNTGEEFEPNYPTIDFTQKGCDDLERFKEGDRVRIRFDISGSKYEDKTTHETKYFTSLRGYRIEPYVQPQAQHVQQPVYPPQQAYQQNYQQTPPQQAMPQQPPYPPQQGNNGLPF